jgi:two-component system, OmpR family, sensor kinase
MRVTGWLRRYSVEVGWSAFAAANVAAMIADPSWETVPFHFVWISLTLVYGFRVWSNRTTTTVLAVVILSTGTSIFADAFEGIQLWGELFEVPLMSAMFLAMVWHARRRQIAVHEAEALVEQQERFLHDVSHELRTPVAIARGHLDLLRPRGGELPPEVAIAIDELGRMDRIISRLLLLAKAEQPSFLAFAPLDAAAFLEDVFLRWSEVAPRVWRLGRLAHGSVLADEEALRDALDALLENAVKYTDRGDRIELGSYVLDFGLVIEVIDTGVGIPAEAVDRIFERFARGDAARTRSTGGVGLGLAIVDAVARAHGGACSVQSRGRGTTFALRLPRYTAAGTGASVGTSVGDPAMLPDPVLE